MSKTKVIMDVDTGVDDALAIALACSCENIDLIGISTVGGNLPLKNTYENTVYIMKMLGIDVPIARGKGMPLLKKPVHAPEVHGSQGLGYVVDVPERTEDGLDIFSFYRDLLSKSKEKVTIIATGPLTNIASVLTSMPNLKEKIACISIMGGGVEIGNITAVAEFNIYHDPEAAEIVMKSGIPLILAPLDVTYQAYLTKEEIEKIKAVSKLSYEPFNRMLDYYIDFFIRDTNIPGAALHDSVAVAFVARPEIFTFENHYVTVDTSETSTRGATLIDKYGTLRKKANVSVLKTIEREKMIEMTIASLRK